MSATGTQNGAPSQDKNANGKNGKLAIELIGMNKWYGGNEAGIVLNQTGQAVEVILITMGVYLTISLVTSMIMNWYNARISLVER